jgi:hypothetical protein
MTAELLRAKSKAAKQSSPRHSGMVRQHQTRNLEIPGLVLTHHPGMTTHFFTLLASILIDVSKSFVVNAVSTANGFSMPR